MTTNEFKKMLANPFYCLEKVDPIFTQSHEPMVSEEDFINVGKKLIDEIGAEKYLRLLLDNLKGDYVK